MNWPTFTVRTSSGERTYLLVRHPAHRKLPPEQLERCAWYLRVPAGHPSGKTWHSLESSNLKTATTNARTFLGAWTGDSVDHRAAQAALAGRSRRPLSTIVSEYIAAGCPQRDRMPRTGRALAEERRVLGLALEWWGDRDPRSIRPTDFEAYAQQRTSRSKVDTEAPRPALRAAELELNALSNACAYAVRCGRLEANPFAERPALRAPSQVEHCSAHQPADDDELHRIMDHLFADPRTVVSAARLAVEAMTGLRTSEAIGLRWDARDLGAAGAQPGYMATLATRPEPILYVARAKRGLNPAVPMSAPLQEFVRVWRSYATEHWPGNPWWFPAGQPGRPTPASLERHAEPDQLSRDLGAAAAALQLPRRTSHGLRAYYVSVRRSQGIADAQIGDELGHNSGPALVRSTYGEAAAVFGRGHLDWLPTGRPPAWSVLSSPAADVIPFQRVA